MKSGNTGSELDMAEHKILEERIGNLTGSFSELKEEVKDNQKQQGESLDSIRKSLQSLVVLEKSAVTLQTTITDMREEHAKGITRVHERIDSSMQESIKQGTEFTGHVLKMKDELSKVHVVTVENKTKIEGLQWLQRTVSGAIIVGVVGVVVGVITGIYVYLK